MASPTEQAVDSEAGAAIPDVITLMHDDHQRLRLQIEQGTADGDLHQLLQSGFSELLRVHESCEMAVFWPALRTALPSTEELVQSRLQEEEGMLAWLESRSAEQESEEMLSDRMRLLLAHMDAEEHDDWATATSAISLEHLLALGAKFLGLKHQLSLPDADRPAG